MAHDTPLSGANSDYLEALYEQFSQDPGSVSADWREYFKTLNQLPAGAKTAPPHTPPAGGGLCEQLTGHAEKQVKVLELISAFRYRGHRNADLDPLHMGERPHTPDLHPSYYGFSDADMHKHFFTSSLFGLGAEATLGEIYSLLSNTYCGSIGTELGHITSNEQKRWVQEYLETRRGSPDFDAGKKRDILHWTTASRKLEEFLHRKYVGQKRFSLEGSENFIPALDEIIQCAGSEGVEEIIIGMAHRGRLNVLVNIFGKHPNVLFSEFEGKVETGSGAGDVKYHLGFSSDIKTPGGPVHIVLAFNPSHLEIINPVVEGSVRARQDRRNDLESKYVLPVLVHGDAAVAGQGVVTETLNLSETRGYRTGGTVHVVINNQIGFTTSDPLDSRSTLYCTDVAKLVQAPVFHVNGNDAQAVVFVARLALEFRMRFNKDVVMDIVSFRRWGHNEADEPFATQPMMYTKIRDQKGPRKLFAEQLEAEGVLQPGESEKMGEAYFAALERDQVMSRERVKANNPFIVDWAPYLGTHWRAPYDSSVSIGDVEDLGTRMCLYPEHFKLHRSVKRIIDARLEMARGKKQMDWGFAENLAYATIIRDGHPVRLSGQDSQRGTFFHRHSVLHNQLAPGTCTPLQNLFKDQPNFRAINSLLSELAVLGFEYGYSASEPNVLVVWEAQFGDFVNGAQVVIDQFLCSSESKWARFSGLVLLLPHGYDGMGPEHSSARLERFLQLCANDNIQVVNPTTPAQMFHLLRRQMLRKHRTPLIVMSPKSLLRHRSCVSSREELTRTGFQVVIDDVDELAPAKVKRLVLCSGKIYYDLLEKRREQRLSHIAIARIEQLYPYPREEIRALLSHYANANEICWAQEEPRNQGSWFFMLSGRHLMGDIDRERHTLHYAGREYSASPAVGYMSLHLQQQRGVVASALCLEPSSKAG